MFYGEEYHAERYTRLQLMGFDSDPYFDPWDTAERNEYCLRNLDLRESERRLEHCLIERLLAGTLFATGYAEKAALDENASKILPDRWRTLTPDFTTSSATAPGLNVTGILVFDPQKNSADLSKVARGFSQAELKRWYKQWIAECGAAGRSPSRDEDWTEARRVFERPVPRDALRLLRREMAPSSWRSRGRRRQGA